MCKYLIHLLPLLAITILIGCVDNTRKSTTSSQIHGNQTKTNVQPIIEQDVYIREAIHQIELSKSKLYPEKKKVFIGEYTYRASDTDSKITSRSKAAMELKKIILSEIGVHISSSLKITKQATIDKRVKTEINHVITSYTAGTVSMKIIKEKWDGSNFYLKGKISIDPNSVIEGISEGLKAEAERKTIQQLKTIITTQNETLNLRSNKLINIQNELSRSLLLVKTKEGALSTVRSELELAKKKLLRYEAEELKTKSELNKIRTTITKISNKAYNNLVTGMTKRDVINIVGKPRSTANCNYDAEYFNYGRVWVVFLNGVTTGWISNNKWGEPCFVSVYGDVKTFATNE